MADGTGTVLDHVWLVQIIFLHEARGRMLFVARLALAVDRREIEAAMEPIAHHGFEFGKRTVAREHRALVVTAGAILRIGRVVTRNRAGAEEFFADAFLRQEPLENDDAHDAADNGEEAGAPARHPPGMLLLVITEVAFVALGDLLLGSSWRGHDLSNAPALFVLVSPARARDRKIGNDRSITSRSTSTITREEEIIQ